MDKNLFFTINNQKLSYYSLLSGFIIALWLGVFTKRANPNETVIKTDLAKQYEELHFIAERGVEYTLQKSHNLRNWNNDIKFIGNGNLVKLRLFALDNNVLPHNGNDAPYTVVSGSIRKVSTGGTYVSWISLEGQSVKHAFFPTVELASHFSISYSGLKSGFYLFLSQKTAHCCY